MLSHHALGFPAKQDRETSCVEDGRRRVEEGEAPVAGRVRTEDRGQGIVEILELRAHQGKDRGIRFDTVCLRSR